MKKKKYKKNRKQLKRKRIIISSLYIFLVSLSWYFFFKSYQYISDIPKANNITQEEIYDLTRIGEADIKLVRALKNDAFDSWLYEANSDKAKQLPKMQKTIVSIIEGEVEVSDIDQVIDELQKDVDIINDSSVEELYVLYYKAVLPGYYDKANNFFQKMTIAQPEKEYQDIFVLLDLLNKIYSQKGMQSVTNDMSFKQATSLLDEINNSINEVNEIKSLVVRYDSLNEPISEPKTKFGMELNRKVYETNDYINSKIMVKEFEKKYDELRSNLDRSKELIKKATDFPDLVGLTIEEAQQETNKAKLDLTVKGYTNRFYKSGERVPENQREMETWDDDKQDKILSQSPSYLEYDFIIEGATIEVLVENQPVKKPEETSESSSSSISNSSTTSSSSTEETTTTKNSKDDLDE